MDAESERRRLARAAWPTQKIALTDDAEAIDRDAWRAMTAAERVAWVWTLTVAQWEMKGVREDQLRVCRSVASVQRRMR